MASKVILVTGGRYFNLKEDVAEVLGQIHAKFGIAELHEGGATGADHLCKMWALMNNIPVFTHEADWKLYGNRAGSIRNARMLRHAKPDLVVAFPGGNGTTDMVNRAVREKVPTMIGRFVNGNENMVGSWSMHSNG